MYAYEYVGAYYSFFILTCLNSDVNNKKKKKIHKFFI